MHRLFTALAFMTLLSLAGCGAQPSDYQSDVPVSTVEKTDDARSDNTVSEELPNEVNLDVPFFSQAPTGDWGEPYQESCEEASVLLAYYFVTGQTPTAEEFEEDLLAIVDWEVDRFGQYEHTTVEQTAEIADQHLNYRSYEIVSDPSAEDIKGYLAAGYPVVAPFAGRYLGNPYFTGEGPVYHMLVIRGYDAKGRFITNDVGTRHGESFVYSEQTIMTALHDWHDDAETDPEGILNGKKVILVLK
jgi:predicted small lipoprotein YifL